MDEPRRKTISYHRAEFFGAQPNSINLGLCIKQATDKLHTAPLRSIERAGGKTMRIAHFLPDDRKGYYLHLTVDTPGQHTSVVPKISGEAVEIKVGTLAPSNDWEFMDGDAFLYVRGDDICLCATTVRTGSIVYFLRELFRAAAIRKDAYNFNFRHAVDTAKLAMIQRSGVKFVRLRGTLYKSSLDYQKRKAKAMGLLGFLSNQVRAFVGTPRLASDDALKVELTLTVDGHRKGGLALGHRRLQALAISLVEDEESDDQYLIITNDNQEITSSEIILRSKADIDSMGKSVQRDAAWAALREYYDSLVENGSLVQ